jgi:hypothetical protein
MNNEANESNDNHMIKNENEKLKLALAQSNHATRKLEEEIQTFKNNNSRLTNALQEGHLTSEDLKKQLQFYKEECTRLRSTKSMTNSNIDLNDSFSKSLTLNTSNPKFKQELARLTDSFDKKLNELNEIRQQLKNLLNDIQ